MIGANSSFIANMTRASASVIALMMSSVASSITTRNAPTIVRTVAGAVVVGAAAAPANADAGGGPGGGSGFWDFTLGGTFGGVGFSWSAP